MGLFSRKQKTTTEPVAEVNLSDSTGTVSISMDIDMHQRLAMDIEMQQRSAIAQNIYQTRLRQANYQQSLMDRRLEAGLANQALNWPQSMLGKRPPPDQNQLAQNQLSGVVFSGTYQSSQLKGRSGGTLMVDDISDHSDIVHESWWKVSASTGAGYEEPNPTGVTNHECIFIPIPPNPYDPAPDRRLFKKLADGWRITDYEFAPGRVGIRMERLTNVSATLHASDQSCSCVNCGKHDASVSPRSYTGIREADFGTQDANDCTNNLAMADLCETCHQELLDGSGCFEADPIKKRIAMSERFMYCVMMTLLRRVGQNALTVTQP
jgi:hypothetical protein